MSEKLIQADLFVTEPVDPNNAYLRLKDGTLLAYAGRLPRHSSLEKEVNENEHIGIAFHCDLEGILYWVAIPPLSDSSKAFEFMLENTPSNLRNAKELLRDKALA